MDKVRAQSGDESEGRPFFKNPLLAQAREISQQWRMVTHIDIATDGLEQAGVRLNPGDQVRFGVLYKDGSGALLTFEFVGMDVDPELKGPAFRFVEGPRSRAKDVDKVGQFVSVRQNQTRLDLLFRDTQALFRPRFGNDETVKGFKIGTIQNMEIRASEEGLTTPFKKEPDTVPGKRIHPAERKGIWGTLTRFVRSRIRSDVPRA